MYILKVMTFAPLVSSMIFLSTGGFFPTLSVGLAFVFEITQIFSFLFFFFVREHGDNFCDKVKTKRHRIILLQRTVLFRPFQFILTQAFTDIPKESPHKHTL